MKRWRIMKRVELRRGTERRSSEMGRASERLPRGAVKSVKRK